MQCWPMCRCVPTASPVLLLLWGQPGTLGTRTGTMGQPQTQQRVQRASDISEFLLIFLKITGLSGFHRFGFLLSLAVITNFLLYYEFSLSLCLLGPLCPLPGFSWCGTDGGPRGSVSNSRGQAKPVSAAVPLISGVIPPRQRQCLPVRLLGPAIT